jgi:hypothetical protein
VSGCAEKREHIAQAHPPEEFYFVLEGTGRIRVDDETLTVPRYGAFLVGPEELEFLEGSKSKMIFRSSIRSIRSNCKSNSPAGVAADELVTVRFVLDV